jgi:hypothetical protein
MQCSIRHIVLFTCALQCVTAPVDVMVPFCRHQGGCSATTAEGLRVPLLAWPAQQHHQLLGKSADHLVTVCELPSGFEALGLRSCTVQLQPQDGLRAAPALKHLQFEQCTLLGGNSSLLHALFSLKRLDAWCLHQPSSDPAAFPGAVLQGMQGLTVLQLVGKM